MRRSILVMVILLGVLVGLAPYSASQAQSGARCFPETGFCISGPIRAYWEQNGGLPVFGFPITPLQTETIESWTGPVQWFERDRLEDHTNEGKGVLAGRLGVERLAQQGRPWQFRPYPGDVAGCRGFRETGYHICGGFLSFWERNGGLERFGYPVTGQITERLEGRDFTVQYFERRRMEFHPENRPPFDILLGLLGREIRAGGTPAPTPAPTATPQPSQQIFLDTPLENEVVPNPVRVVGRTARMPANNRLNYRVYEPNGPQLASGTIGVEPATGQSGRFVGDISFRSPSSGRLVIELNEVDPATGAVVAWVQRNVRTLAAAVQSITIDEPRQGDRVGTAVLVRGRTSLYPSGGDLEVRAVDNLGAVITGGTYLISGQPGQPASFSVQLFMAPQGGRPVTIEVRDVDSRGEVLAVAAVTVTVGNQPYPTP